VIEILNALNPEDASVLPKTDWGLSIKFLFKAALTAWFYAVNDKLVEDVYVVQSKKSFRYFHLFVTYYMHLLLHCVCCFYSIFIVAFCICVYCYAPFTESNCSYKEHYSLAWNGSFWQRHRAKRLIKEMGVLIYGEVTSLAWLSESLFFSQNWISVSCCAFQLDLLYSRKKRTIRGKSAPCIPPPPPAVNSHRLLVLHIFK